MKILNLKFANLNSLTGNWEIDFSNSTYISEGIFAITGATGSGKTTILDAICLALFGRTPRLEKINKSENEIINRQRVSCFAEVTFETSAGKFRCYFSQHRARHQLSGELQPQFREISSVETGLVLENKLKAVDKLVEEITGLNYQRFTRSVLLAQGGFAAFLQAPVDERAPILEQLTGTEIYSRISILVHQRCSEERQRLKELEIQLEGIKCLSEEQLTELELNKSELNRQATQILKSFKQGEAELTWNSRQTELISQIKQTETALIDCQRDSEQFKPDGIRLKKASLALELEPQYRELELLNQRQTDEQEKLSELNQKLKVLNKIIQQSNLEISDANQTLQQAQQEQSRLLPAIKQAQDLNIRIEEFEKNLTNLKSAVDKTQISLSTTATQLSESSQQEAKVSGELKQLKQLQQEHQQDETLIENLTGLLARIDSCQTLSRRLKIRQQENSKFKSELPIIEKRYQQQLQRQQTIQQQLAQLFGEKKLLSQWYQQREQLNQQREQLQQIQLNIERAQELNSRCDWHRSQIKKLTGQIQQQSEHLEQIITQQISLEQQLSLLETRGQLIRDIKSFKQERTRLIEGQPCPLCGSEHHPYTEKSSPQLEDSEKELNEVRRQTREITEALTDSRVALGRLETSREQSNQQLSEINDEQSELQQQISQQISRNTELSIDDFENYHRLKAELNQQLQKITEQSRQCNQTIEQIEQQSGQLQLLNAETQTQLAGLKQLTNRLEQSSAEIIEISAEQKLLQQDLLNQLTPYGIKSLTELEQTGQLLTRRRNNWQTRQTQILKLQQQHNEAAAESRQLQQLLQHHQTAFEQQHKQQTELENSLTQLKSRRQELIGEELPDILEQRLNSACETSSAKLTNLNNQQLANTTEANAISATIRELQLTTSDRQQNLDREQFRFQTRLEDSGFINKADFVSARLKPEIRHQLAEQELQLNQRHLKLTSRLTELNQSLENHLKIKPNSLSDPRRTIETISAELEQLQLQRQLLHQEIGRIEHQISEHQQNQLLQIEQRKNFQKQTLEYQRFDLLRELIGSADGKKYRNFAQGLTFELLIYRANQQLRQMTGRYTLAICKQQPLDFFVSDEYQGGEIRPTRNLSGGESFIISLSLALGLSRLASRNIEIESLFLDEGFGTLDEETLEMALETLAQLRLDGRLIGIISHIPQIKERISTQIQIISGPGGQSRISGPGCRSLSER